MQSNTHFSWTILIWEGRVAGSFSFARDITAAASTASVGTTMWVTLKKKERKEKRRKEKKKKKKKKKEKTEKNKRKFEKINKYR